MNKNIFTLILIFIIINFGCSNNKRQGLSNESQINLIKFKVQKPNNDSTIFLSSFISEVKIIPLEFNEKCILGKIKKVIIKDSLIFVQDNQNHDGIFRFDISGKFINKIGQMGKGPSEHITLTDFSINQTLKSVYIYSNSQKKLLEHSYNNTFKKEIPLNYAAENFEYQNNFFYLYRENPQIDEKFNLIIKNLDGKTIERYIESEPDKKSSKSNVFLPLKDSLLFHRNLNDTVFCINEENLKYLYYVDFGRHKVKLEDYEKLKDWSTNTLNLLNTNKYIAGIDNLCLLNNTMFFTYIFQNVENKTFCNIKTRKVSSSYSVMDDLSWFTFFSPMTQFDNYLVSVYEPSAIRNNIKNINFYLGNLIPKQEAKSAINKLNSFAEPHEINPILILYKVKHL